MDNQIVALVNLFYAYAQKHPDANMEEFCRHYIAVRDLEKQSMDSSELSKDVRLGITIVRLARFAEMYTKKALAGLPLYNTDEIVYLMILDEAGTPRKSDLINQNLSEFSTGVEIIRRLVKADLVEEFPDADDRRTKRIRITDAGRAVLYQAYPKMDVVATIISGSLAEDEKDLLLQILSRLEKRHDEVYSLVKPKSLDETVAVFAIANV
ncbi:MAG TPA: winged helix DNA-binding protein [Saprospiraceae bacterium]|nr:winged helix DNA-binding protein [Saprospiraceae bacterium]HMP13854.1 winged helix DNA-binding protein [Saprospiraceae bacterium]